MNNDYYVYLHKRKDNGVVFYVGKGRMNRAIRPKRYKEWKRVSEEAGGFDVEYYMKNLSEDDALSVEFDLMNNPNSDWCLVNVNKTNNATKILDFNVLDEYLEYDETSPTCLRWKKWNNSNIKKTARYKGDVAGCVLKEHTGKSYFSVRVGGVSALVHRVIWILKNKTLPKNMIINHIDGNGLNNKIENLEMITQAVNSRRTSKQRKKNNGVYLMTVGKHQYYVCNWSDENSKRMIKLFSLLKHGQEEAFRLATEYRKARIEELNLKFNLGYI